MAGTLFSLIIALAIILNPFISDANFNSTLISIAIIATALLFLLIIPLSSAFSWAPLQKAEQNITPRILQMYRKDKHIGLVWGWLSFFPLASLLIALALSSSLLSPKTLFAIWIILLGISIDASKHLFKRILNYFNPFAALEICTKEAKKACQNEREQDLCEWIDALSEIGIKAMNRHSLSLSNTSVAAQQQIARLFLQSSKSISHHAQDKQTKELGISDKVSYVLFYLYQRLEQEFDYALKNHIEPTCSQIVVSLGKIAIDAAKYDISLAAAPLSFLGKFTLAAQNEELYETVLKASCTLLEVARTILNDIDITYLELKDPFFSIVNTLENSAKMSFKKDKTTNIPLLIQPLVELKQLFTTGKAKEHRDTPAILAAIDRVLGEFEALQLVMNTLPVIPSVPKEDAPPAPSTPSQ